MDSEPHFLTIEDILHIQSRAIDEFGGMQGIRDPELVESAIAQPSASFGGQSLQEGLFEQAAAYAFHITLNHPFIDGNKRTGLIAAIVFLEINGIQLNQPYSEFEQLMLGVAEGTINKAYIAEHLRRAAQDFKE